MEFDVFVNPLLSAIVLIVGLLADGKLISTARYKRNKLYLYGTLIIITLSINLYGAYTSNKDLIESKSEIKDLKSLVKINISKSDSALKTAVKEFDEQRQAIERERENVFIHLQKEIKNNLYNIAILYKDEAINNMKDTSLFFINRLSNVNMKKYQLLSTNKNIISEFMGVSESIDILNQIADRLLVEKKSDSRYIYINNFKLLKEQLYGRFSVALTAIDNFNSYKEFEHYDFSLVKIVPQRKQLEKYLIIENQFKVDDISADNIAKLSKTLHYSNNFK